MLPRYAPRHNHEKTSVTIELPNPALFAKKFFARVGKIINHARLNSFTWIEHSRAFFPSRFFAVGITIFLFGFISLRYSNHVFAIYSDAARDVHALTATVIKSGNTAYRFSTHSVQLAFLGGSSLVTSFQSSAELFPRLLGEKIGGTIRSYSLTELVE